MTDPREPVSAPLRRLSASLLALGRIRLELLAIEVQEEKERVAQLLLWAVLAALLAGFGLLMAVLFITVMLWDSHRLLALAGGTVLLVAGAVAAVRQVRRLTAMPASLFQSSLSELRQDSAALRREPPP
jgi:uncharacterized membrane protein YqjE